MTKYPKIILKPGKEDALQRFHPWLFSGAIRNIKGDLQEGDVVEIFSGGDNYIATGHYQEGSIAVKIFSFLRTEIDYQFWKSKIEKAFSLRNDLGLVSNTHTNAYRLVNSEGDGLPGLVIDFYNGVCVTATSSTGMDNIKPQLADILKEIYEEKLTDVYDKSLEPDRNARRETRDAAPVTRHASRVTISETGHTFLVDIEKGQKTGFFLDQRTNRMFAQFYARDRKVLNAFCYSGAFSVYAIKGGARMVHSVDSSKQAIEWARENFSLNSIDPSLHPFEVNDVRKFLSSSTDKFDMIILDPPAFAKTHTGSHNALQMYIHINSEALKRLNNGGILFTFSCSQAVSRDMFQSALLNAALRAGRKIRILHHLSQGPDHPVSIFHPEGEYLKGLILHVE
jgi:23S rRNA (cytosine1962-C5)-methyltransferase